MTTRIIRATLLVLAGALATPAAFAAAGDYRFDPVSARPAGLAKTDVTVGLIHVPDGKPVPGAVIFQPRVVMAGMEDMPGDATVELGPQPGSYVVHAATAMARRWTLRLSAKVQGEAETVHAAVPFEAGQ